MREDIIKIRENNLVAATLLQLNPKLRLEISGKEFVDLWVELPVDNSRFAIVTWPSRDFQSMDFINILTSIENKIECIYGCPLYVASFDEGKGLLIDILVKWDFGEPIINKNPNLRILDTGNIVSFFDFVRHQDSQIRVLQNEFHKVIKSINLGKDRNGITCNATFVYLRDFSQSYKMNPKPVHNVLDKIHRNLNGQTNNEYPCDFLDDHILAAIRTVYPNADFENSLLVTSTEYRNLLRYRNYIHEYGEIRFLPDFSEIPVEMYHKFENFKGAIIGFDIYMLIRTNKNAFSNEGFELRLPLDGWFDTLNTIVFQLQSLHKVSDIINQ